MKNILSIETSCDDTSVAIVREDGLVISNKIANQDSIHYPYGGIVPELASRNHSYHLLPLIEQTLKETHYTWENIDYLAVTNRPGLLGALMVGLVTTKTLALLLNKTYIAVNHLEGHILSAFLWDKKKTVWPTFPFLALIVSGGHTMLFKVKHFGEYFLISQTVDDAAGEALDKIARLLELGYPGGKEIDKISQSVELGQYSFPKVKLKKSPLNFSFSGLKTAAQHIIHKTKATQNKKIIPYICADYQESIVDQIIDRLDRAVKKTDIKSIVIAGGVSANSRLREKSLTWAKKNQIDLIFPPLKYCTDNAAMIGLSGIKSLEKGLKSTQDTNCYPHSLPEDFYTENIG